MQTGQQHQPGNKNGPLPTRQQPLRITEAMRRLLNEAHLNERITIGHILHHFGVCGFAFVFLLLALLNIVIFMVPFISLIFGIPMIIMAVQMVLGLHSPILPAIIRHQSLPGSALATGLDKAIGWMLVLERYIRPRLLWLTHARVLRIHGLLATLLAIMVSLPIPLFNIPPSLGLAALGIGLLQRDGYFILGAYAIGFWCLMLFRSIGTLAHSLT